MRVQPWSPWLLLALLAGCARSPEPRVPPRIPASRPEAARAALPRLGFTIQAGAFRNVENAARFAEALQAQGLNAVYYAATPGLYRVRFGDFPTREAARVRAEALKSAGILESFYLVAPELPPMALERPQDEQGLRDNLVATSRSYLGMPYLWGGTTAKGFDCSGLAMAVYRLNGLRLPRSSREQFDAGSPVPLDRIQPGDLLFFATNGADTVTHVAIYVGDDTFIHAASRGKRIMRDQLTLPYYRDSFLGARSYL